VLISVSRNQKRSNNHPPLKKLKKEYFAGNRDPHTTEKRVSGVVQTDNNNTIGDMLKKKIVDTRSKPDNIKCLKNNSYDLPYSQLSRSWYKNAQL
jgi:hypothetical protein